MQSISDSTLKVIRNILVILILISTLVFIFMFIKLNSVLSLEAIEREIKSNFWQEYEIVPFNLSNKTVLISAITTNNVDVDYDAKIDTLINRLNKYKSNKYLARLILRFEHEEGNTKYIQKEYELEIFKVY